MENNENDTLNGYDQSASKGDETKIIELEGKGSRTERKLRDRAQDSSADLPGVAK